MKLISNKSNNIFAFGRMKLETNYFVISHSCHGAQVNFATSLENDCLTAILYGHDELDKRTNKKLPFYVAKLVFDAVQTEQIRQKVNQLQTSNYAEFLNLLIVEPNHEWWFAKLNMAKDFAHSLLNDEDQVESFKEYIDKKINFSFLKIYI